MSIFKISLWSIFFTFSFSIILLNSKTWPTSFVSRSKLGKISLNKDNWFFICSSFILLRSFSSAFFLKTSFNILILDILLSCITFSWLEIACRFAFAVPNCAIMSFLFTPKLSSSSFKFIDSLINLFCSIFLIFWLILNIASISYKSISRLVFLLSMPKTYWFRFCLGLFLDSYMIRELIPNIDLSVDNCLSRFWPNFQWVWDELLMTSNDG